MKVLYKTRFFLFFLLAGLLILTLSCTEKPAEKKTISDKTVITSVEATFYIDSLYKQNGKYYAVIDRIEYKKRTDSNDKNKQNRIDLPNGYYIFNEKVNPVKKGVADSVTITMQTVSYDEYGNFKFNEKTGLTDLLEIFNKPENKRYKHIPFKITLSNDVITSIAEIYIP